MRQVPPPCVLCSSEPATRRGEHVLPGWYLKDRDVIGPPPFEWSKGGEPLRGRDGEPLQRSERTRLLLPVGRTCNGELDRRFEKPAKEPLRRLFAERGDTKLTGAEVEAVGLWLAKTLLLVAHPLTRYSDPIVDRHALRWDSAECPSARCYDWLVSDRPPPDGLSVWLGRTDERQEDPGTPEHIVPLPTLTADGDTIEFVVFQQSFHGLHVTLLIHPGWAVEHPLERSAQVARLHPSCGPVDVSSLPVLPRRTVSWLRCRVVLRDGALGSPGLPPLSSAMGPFGVQADLLPYVTSWSA